MSAASVRLAMGGNLFGALDPAARLREVPWEALAGLGPVVAAALGPVLAGGPAAAKPAERALDRLLRSHRGLSAAQRQACAEALFGVALWRRRLLCQAGLHAEAEACGETDAPPADAGLLLCSLLRDLGGAAEERAVLLSGCGRAPAQGQPRTWGERLSFPLWLEERLARDLGAEAEAFAAAVSTPGPIFLRPNPLRGDPAALAEELRRDDVQTTPCLLATGGLRVTSLRPNLLVLKAFRQGRFEVQDEGSQLLGALVGALPGETVFDACAGAGGKSLQLAASMGNRGRVICADPDGGRLLRLRERADRAGAEIVEVAGSEAPGDLLADRVLVDAPCSETGALRRGPDARWRIDPQALTALPALQLEILVKASRHLRPGGRLVYATCSVLRAENDEVAEAFERAHPEFVRRAPGAGWREPSLLRGGFFTAMPHLHGTDGFFAAVWERASPPGAGVVDSRMP